MTRAHHNMLALLVSALSVASAFLHCSRTYDPTGYRDREKRIQSATGRGLGGSPCAFNYRTRRRAAPGPDSRAGERNCGGAVASASSARRIEKPGHARPSLCYLPMTGALPGPQFILSAQKNHDDRDDGRQIPIRTSAPPKTLPPTATSPDHSRVSSSSPEQGDVAATRDWPPWSACVRETRHELSCVVWLCIAGSRWRCWITTHHNMMRCDAVAGVISFLGRYSKLVAGLYVPFCTKLFFELMIYRASYLVAIRRRYIRDMGQIVASSRIIDSS